MKTSQKLLKMIVERDCNKELRCLIMRLWYEQDSRQRSSIIKKISLQVAPQAESLSDLYETVVASPSRKYFMGLILTFVGFIFFVGLLFGRVIVPRRHIALKNK